MRTDTPSSPLPWVDEPLVFIDADDIEQKRRDLIDAGATALGEVADGNLLGLRQALSVAW